MTRRSEERSYALLHGHKRYDGKPCIKCGSTQRLTSNKSCADCATKRGTAWFKANPDAVKQKNLKRNYGINLEEYTKRYDTQHGLCAICKTPHDVLCVDHSHDTGKVRGLLCHPCNRGIGLLKESADTLRAAISYLYE